MLCTFATGILCHVYIDLSFGILILWTFDCFKLAVFCLHGLIRILLHARNMVCCAFADESLFIHTFKASTEAWPEYSRYLFFADTACEGAELTATILLLCYVEYIRSFSFSIIDIVLFMRLRFVI